MSSVRAPAAAAPRAAEVRREIRAWRRGRAELNYWEVFSDLYIALFAVVMVGSMAGNVVLGLRRLADVSCTGTCAQGRVLGPWLCALALTALPLGGARLLGPVFSPPAANAWLLSTPVDRGGLLRPGWIRTVALTVAGAAVVLAGPALLGGFDTSEGVVFVVAGVATSLACVATAALSQLHQHPAAKWATWLVTGALWALLALAAGDRLGGLAALDVAFAPGLAAVCVLVAGSLVARVVSSLPGMSRRVLAHTEHLSPSLSGASSSLDLGLMYDVLLARRWGRHARVASRTGGPRGWWALVHRDLRRALRAPQPYVVLAGMTLLPYAAAAADAGRAVVLVTTLAGFLAGPALLAGLRVVVRTDGLARMLASGGPALRAAHVVVPGAALLAYGLATAWTLPSAMPLGDAVAVSLACGLSAVASSVRWVTARPPDYARPLVSTPAGAVPPGVLASVLRGFDVWAVTALPLTFPGWGPVASVVLSSAVLAYLLSDHAT